MTTTIVEVPEEFYHEPVLLGETVEAEREEVTNLWPPFLGFGLLFFFMEILLRRLGKVHVSDVFVEHVVDQASVLSPGVNVLDHWNQPRARVVVRSHHDHHPRPSPRPSGRPTHDQRK